MPRRKGVSTLESTQGDTARGGAQDASGSIPTNMTHKMKKLENKIETMLESKFDQLLKQGVLRLTTAQVKVSSSSYFFL